MKTNNSIVAIVFLLICLEAAALFYDGVNKSFNASFVFGVMFLAVGSLLIYFRFLILKNNRDDEYRDLIKEFEYLRHNTLTGVLIGIGAASVIVGIGAMIYKPEDTNVFHEKIFEILTLYTTSITSFLVIRTIFERVAPITNVETLLLRVCDDIDELIKKENGNIVIVYPALIIGYYREKTNRVLEKHYNRYSSALHHVADSPSITATVVTYDPKHYVSLFDAYVEMNIENYDESSLTMIVEKATEVNDCVDEANRKFNDFRDASHRNCKTYGIGPIDLKEHFVVIGDIVYTITSFGLPVAEVDANGNVVFTMPSYIEDKKKLAKLYAFRQHDRDLANLITKKITKSLSP